MEASLVEERICERREPILVSQSIHLPREPISIELAANDDKQAAEICEHFTIRGYVGGVRKRDAKICWPFFMLQNHKSDEYADLFPPIPVTKFRHWNCVNCLCKADATAAAVLNEDPCQNNKVKDNSTSLHGSIIMASHTDEKTLLTGIQQLSEEKIVERQLIEADSSIHESNAECHPSLCPVEKENEPVIKDLIEEDLQIPKASHDNCETIQNQPNDNLTIVTTGRACPSERTVVHTTNNTTGTALGEDASDILHTKSKGTELVHEITDSEMAAYPTFNGNDVAISEQKQCDDVTRHMPDIDSMGSDKNDHEASDSDIGLTEHRARCEKHANEVLASDRKSHRKARKVRLLDDIIRSEDSDAMSKKVCISTGDAEAGQTEVNINRGADSCKVRHELLDHKIRLADRKTKIKPSKGKAKFVALENEDKGPSLMNWLKRVAKKDMTRKGDAEIKHIVATVVNSRPAADASAGNCLEFVHKDSGIKRKKSKSIAHRKQNEKTLNHLMPWQDIMNVKGHIVAEDAPNNNIHSKTIDSELNGIIITGQILHDGSKIQDSNCKKVIMSKKKRKEPQVEDGGSSQMHLSKDYFGKRGHANIIDFQGQKVKKKRRTARKCGKDTLDDIPMDIVELLAKNQHERQLMDAKAATDTMQNLSEMPGNLNRNGLSGTEDHGNMVLDAMHEDLSQQKTLSSNMVNGQGSNWNAEPSSSNGKRSNDMDLNKEDAVFASIGHPALLECRNQPRSCIQPPKSESKNNCFAQSYCWNRVRMPTLGPCQTSQATSGQNMRRDSHGQSSVLLNGNPFRVNLQNADSASNYMNSFCHDPLRQRKVKIVAHETDNLKFVNQDRTRTNKERTEPSANKRTFSTATSFAEVGNALYPKEVIPATHLLRLMDSATWSDASLKETLDLNRTGFILESDLYSNDQCYEFAALEDKVKTNQILKHPSTVGHPDHGQHYGNACRPLRPLPRIGVFGSLLQKEITTRLHNCGTQFGPKIGQSNELKSHETNGKGKSEWLHMDTHARILNAQTAFSRNENIKQLSNNCGTRFGLKSHSNGSNSCETYEKEKSEWSHMATHTRVLNSQIPLSRNENTGQLHSDVKYTGLPGCSLARDDMVQVNLNSEATAVQPSISLSELEICVVNRNPADFTILDEDNDYMIASEDLRPRCINPTGYLKYPNRSGGQKRRKAMKLIAPLWFVRS